MNENKAVNIGLKCMVDNLLSSKCVRHNRKKRLKRVSKNNNSFLELFFNFMFS